MSFARISTRRAQAKRPRRSTERQQGAGHQGRRHQADRGQRNGRTRDRSFRPRPFPVQFRRRRHPPRQISRDRRHADGEDLRAQRQRHALRHASLLPHMLANKHGVIVNMASMAHRRGGPGSSIHYAAAKGAVVSMTLGVAREFATQGIRALSISPGPIKTPFQDAAQSSPELIQQFLDECRCSASATGGDRRTGLFICSDACEFMTADTVYVNGGGGWR